MTQIKVKYNLFEKGDEYFHLNLVGAFGSRMFSTEEAATIAGAIYDVMLQQSVTFPVSD